MFNDLLKEKCEFKVLNYASQYAEIYISGIFCKHLNVYFVQFYINFILLKVMFLKGL